MEDPLSKFLQWQEEAKKDPVINPDIVALATATPEGRPSVRMVFFRGIREGGFSFFTNYDSRKGSELQANPFAAMTFYWPHLGRQVRVEGVAERLSAAESDAYFQSRPLESRITATASRQSRPLEEESEFYGRIAELEKSEPSRPEDWGGFKIIPAAFEFWIHGEHRRHHRTLYMKEGDRWDSMRLYP